MNDLLVIAALIFAGLHQKEDRLAVLFFSVPLLIYGVVDEYIPADMGTLYLLGATGIDLAIMFYLSRLARISKLIDNVQKACEAFIYINFCGWVAYKEFLPSGAYNNTCTIIYIWVLIKIIDGGGWSEFRDIAMDWWLSRIYSSHRASGFAQISNKKEIKN